MTGGGSYGYPADYAFWLLLYGSVIVHTWFFFRLSKDTLGRRVRLVVGNAFVLACLLGFVALMGETYFRFLAVETDSFGLSLPARRWFETYTRLNSLDYRDKEWALEKPPGVRRIAFVGDSFTYGWGVKKSADRFPDRIQAMFEARAPGSVEVMNVAKAGWDTSAQLPAVREMIDRYEIDEVVLCHVPNDVEKLLPRSAEFDPIAPPMPVLVNASSSSLVDYLFRRVWLPRVPSVHQYHDWLADGFDTPEVWQLHRQQLHDIVTLCRDRGVTIRVALLPFIRTNGTRFDGRRLHAALRRFFEANGVAVLDLFPAIAGRSTAELVVSAQDAHPNEAAHALFATSLWKRFYADSSR